MRKHSSLAIGLSAMLLWSCANEETPIDPALVSLYVELRVASLEYGMASQEARIARQNLMREASWDSEEFKVAIEEIRTNPELWKRFQQQVVDQLDSLRKESRK